MGEAAADILVVHDTPANVRLLKTILEARGYEVRSASSGAEALAAVAERRPDLVLLDVVMPGMDGLEACRRLRADPATAALPVLMVTASDHSDKVTALDAGADDFVTKPFDQAELLARMRSLLRIKAYQATIEAQAATLASLNQDLEARIRHQVEELERLNLLRRFLPPQLADAIVASGDDSVLEDHRAEIAVLYTGLRGFTQSRRPPRPRRSSGSCASSTRPSARWPTATTRRSGSSRTTA